ncbi:ferritin-like domain-containing protein [Paenarthrobacter sp. CCNWYY172]|uniref:ferritin-like domain-containing protein n=1 Tax=unclassified Paenarthrobacter TaxID=2634190 RepID=UPI0030773161
MSGQTSEKQRTPPWGRALLVTVVALLVAGTGIVLIPRDSGTPPPVPFSEAARAGALEDTLQLRESAATLSSSAGQGADQTALKDAVTLLTTQARALLVPSEATPSATATTAGRADGTTRSAFVAALSASGTQRLADAYEADGGIARLLAAVGSAQVLGAEKLAGAWQLPIPKDAAASKTPIAAATPPTAPCPSVSPTPEPTSATTDASLAATVRIHQEAVYAYQVALKRLDTASAGTAAKGLAAHELLLQQVEALTRANCGDVPASEAGYRLPEQFAQDPAAALAAMESSALPVMGDLVALSTGGTRAWAVDGLLAAARRSLAWGADVPALPGLTLDAGELPPLPTPGSAGDSATGPASGSASTTPSTGSTMKGSAPPPAG